MTVGKKISDLNASGSLIATDKVEIESAAGASAYVLGSAIATYAQSVIITTGSFTGTLTGYATPPTGTVNWIKFGSNIAWLYIPSAITGTSNATTLTMTGLPAGVTPSVARVTPIFYITDNSASTFGVATVNTNNTITFSIATSIGVISFTGSGTKGLGPGWYIQYPL